MKNKIILFVLLLGSLAGCQDRLKREFQNQEQHAPRPEEIMPGMLTQMLYTRFYVVDYGEWYYMMNGLAMPAYAQLNAAIPMPSWQEDYVHWNDMDGTGVIKRNSQTTSRFGYYYNDLKNWGLMRDEIATLSGGDLAENEIFFMAATVLKDAVGMQTVDIFNRIPYSEGFEGTQGVFFPKYDDPKEIYKSALIELASLAGRFQSVYDNMSVAAKSSFAKNDIAFKGEVNKWIQYCNALILRHGVRMSGVDEAFVKPLLAEAVKKLPEVDFIWDNPKTNQNTFSNSGGEIYSRSLLDVAYGTYIPNTLMARMNLGGIEYVPGEDDPRLPVIASPTRYSDANPTLRYVGITMDYDKTYSYWPTAKMPPLPADTPEDDKKRTTIDYGEGLSLRAYVYRPYKDIGMWVGSSYSTYNLGTFIYGNIPPYMTSLAEVDLLLAEAAAKGLATTGKSAADHVRDAVIHSTAMWYDINNGNGTVRGTNIWQTPGFLTKRDLLVNAFNPARPDNAIVEKFADIVKGQMTGSVEEQMEVIMQQKYVHLNILNPYELWAELRRTRHPKLEKMTIGGQVLAPMLERALYPASELANNEKNYYTVQDEDNLTSPIFWVSPAKKTESYYREDYLPTPGMKPLPSPNPNKTDMKEATKTIIVPTIN